MPSVFPVGFSLIIPTESSFPSTGIHKSGCTSESPGELLKTTDARTPRQINRSQISDGRAQASVVFIKAPLKDYTVHQG